ncbi:MAG: hypothetical protein WCA27_31460 [Candidatus Sulfotelmatobacter sp.]
MTTESALGTERVEGKKIAVKAIVISQYGGPEVLKLQDVEIASPARGQALVRLAMAGVNFVDIHQRRGTHPQTTSLYSGTGGRRHRGEGRRRSDTG